MTLADAVFYAGSAVRRHRLRTVLSVLGVSIGVLSVILLTSLGEGARLYVTGEFASLGTNILILMPGKVITGMPAATGGTTHDLTLDDIEVLRRRLPRARHIAPLVVGTGSAHYGDLSRDTLIVGTTSELQTVRRIHINAGEYLPAGEDARGAQVCVIGPKVQQELFRGVNPLGEFLRLGDERYRVIGVTVPRGMSLGMDLDEVVHIPVGRAMKMFNRTSLFRVLIEMDTFEGLDPARLTALDVLKQRHDGIEDVTALTQDSVVSAFADVLAVLTAVLAGIAAISLSVAGIGIMNVMLVSVSERTSEIGLMKALGAAPAQVQAVFLAEAAILSMSGGVIGLAGGLALAAGFRSIYPVFPAQPPLWAVFSAILVSISVGLLFGTLPARRASRMDPVKALSRK